jgi:hypothetical protein
MAERLETFAFISVPAGVAGFIGETDPSAAAAKLAWVRHALAAKVSPDKSSTTERKETKTRKGKSKL